MFTGLIQAIGVIVNNLTQSTSSTSSTDSNDWSILTLLISQTNPANFWSGVGLGDSIAVDGVCLTVHSLTATHVTFRISGETRSKTRANEVGRAVNLERALKFGDHLGGHITSGHVHTITRVTDVNALTDKERDIWFAIPIEFLAGVVYKESICLNGVSLTIAEVNSQRQRFRVSLIQQTLERTTLSQLKPGDLVNVEFNQHLQPTPPTDEYYMRLAIAEGEKGRLTTAPNPWVGCVIVKNGQIIGQGHHVRAGQEHAEVLAIQNAASYGQSVQGATVYVTLEPCHKFGRQPPCDQALIKAGVKKVVIGLIDPDHRTNGLGKSLLLEHGIEVVAGVCQSEVEHSLKPYIHARQTELPYVISKVALTLDGCYALTNGSSKWITGETARQDGHRLRATSQAIIVGHNTVLADNPMLTVRNIGAPLNQQPLRVVIDAQGSCASEDLHILNQAEAHTLIFTTQSASQSTLALWKKHNVEVITHTSSKIDLFAVLSELYKRGVIQALVEGGPELEDAFMQRNLVQEAVVYRSLTKVVGPSGRPWSQSFKLHVDPIDRMENATTNWRLLDSKIFDNQDMVQRFEIISGSCAPVKKMSTVRPSITTAANACGNDAAISPFVSLNHTPVSSSPSSGSVTPTSSPDSSASSPSPAPTMIDTIHLAEKEEELTFTDFASALASFKAGSVVIVMDDTSRENEGDLIVRADMITPEQLTFIKRWTTGIICVTMSGERAKLLGLERMVPLKDCTDPLQTAFTITCDGVDTTTGVSSLDRVRTIKALASLTPTPTSIRRPGHIFPLIARDGGLLTRRGHTEAGVDLCKLAGANPEVSVICELTNDDGTMMRYGDCYEFSQKFNIPIIHINQIIDGVVARNGGSIKSSISSSAVSSFLKPLASCSIKLNNLGDGAWQLATFASKRFGEHVPHRVLVKGERMKKRLEQLVTGVKNDDASLDQVTDPVMIRIHSECFTGDVLNSSLCDCNQQLHESLRLLSSSSSPADGLLIFPSNHEGRGIGLSNKLKTYQLQQSSAQVDTYLANRLLGLEEDARDYNEVMDIIRALVSPKQNQVTLLTSNPAKIASMKQAGFEVRVQPIICKPSKHNERYLKSKALKHGHHQHAHTEESTSNEKPIPTQSTSTSSSSTSTTTPVVPSKPVNPSHPGTFYGATVSPLKEIDHAFSAKKICIIQAGWHKPISDVFISLVRGELKQLGYHAPLYHLLAPGCFEIPVLLSQELSKGGYDGYVVIGGLLKGETLHFEMISTAVVTKLMDLQCQYNIPVINCVLNCMTQKQMEERFYGHTDMHKSIAATIKEMVCRPASAAILAD